VGISDWLFGGENDAILGRFGRSEADQSQKIILSEPVYGSTTRRRPMSQIDFNAAVKCARAQGGRRSALSSQQDL
jgi:hypothetical protein